MGAERRLVSLTSYARAIIAARLICRQRARILRSETEPSHP
jgi:hypothetical protein